MNPESASTATLPPPPPTAPAPKPTWRQALLLLREHPRETLLPMAVFQLPLTVLVAGAYFYLYYEAYPSADFESLRQFEGAPSGLILSLILMTAIYLFLSLVGTGATIVAVRTVLDRRPARLVESLDPAFTRMGALLTIGAVFYVMVLGIAAFIVILLYPLFRWGLAVHALLLEGSGVGGALGTSWRLLRGNLLRFTAVALSAIPVGIVVFTAASVVFAIGLAPFGADPGRTGSLVAQSLSMLLLGIVATPTGAYFAAATTIFYLSLKEQSRA